MDWLAVAGIVFGILALWYAARSESVSLHPSQKGMFVGIGFALLGSSAWFTFQKTVPTFNAESLFSVGILILSLPLLGFVLTFPVVRRRSGDLLQSFPRSRVRKYSGLVTASLFLVLLAFRTAQEGVRREMLPEIIFYAAVTLYFASPVFGRIEVRRVGILESYVLFRWQNIASYRWIGQSENDLTLGLKRGWRKIATISFRPEEREIVEQYLHEYTRLAEPRKEGS